MKKLNLYYVFDNVGETVVTGVIPASSHLTAALGFRNAYIQNKKSELNYKNLTLVCCDTLQVDDKGEYHRADSVDQFILDGNKIIDFIREQIQAKGLDDEFLDEEVEEDS